MADDRLLNAVYRDAVYRFAFPNMEFNTTQGRMIPPWEQQRGLDPSGYLFGEGAAARPDLQVQQKQLQLELEKRQLQELRRTLGF